MTSGSLESQCMYYEGSRCYLHASFPTECHLCFNFSSANKVIDRGKIKPFYTLFDYLRSTGTRDIIFPKKNDFQRTL